MFFECARMDARSTQCEKNRLSSGACGAAKKVNAAILVVSSFLTNILLAILGVCSVTAMKGREHR